MDAFFASAEQASKPSLRGKAVVVGGLGPRGVVSTASYEARVFGVNSAMPMAQARRRAPNAAYLVPRFALYKEVSEQVMGLLRALSPLVEPLSLDEAFVDLEAGGTAWDERSARLAGVKLRADIRAVTGLTGSVGLAASKMLAKIASEQAKPDGLVLIDPGTERELLGPMSVRTLPGVGPATGTTCGGPGSPRSRRSPRRARTSSYGCWGRPMGTRCSRWRWRATTGPWCPTGRRSRCRWRTRTTWTSTTGSGWASRWRGSRTAVCGGCAGRACRAGPSC